MTKTKKAYCLISFVLAVVVFLAVFISSFASQPVYASEESDSVVTTSPNDELLNDVSETTNGLSITYNNETGSVSTPVKMLLFLTIISVAPSLLIMLTSYTRIIIVLHFLRTAIGTQTSPPNQVLIGLALFLTFFIMWPTFKEINETAIQPLDNGEITMEEFFETAETPLREFMYGQIQVKDVSLFIDISGEEYDIDFDEGSAAFDELPMTIIVPSFIIGELRQAFIMGFIIYIPFIVIDMVVASVLMSMGMMMLPPTTISLPFKVLLFILADGWNLVIGSLVQTFY